jgi:hypothetical protein
MHGNLALKELQGEELDMVSAGKHLLHFKLHHGDLHLGNLHLDGLINQTNIAIQIAVAAGGSIIQVINQSNVIS